MKTIFLVMCYFLTLYATTIEQLVEKTLHNAPSLDAVKAKIAYFRANEDLALQFANPSVSIASNSLSQSEKMAQTTLTLKQKIYFYGKRDAKAAIAKRMQELEGISLERLQVELAFLVKKSSYEYLKTKELLKIIQSYIELTKESIDLFESYSANSDGMHMGLMNAELVLSDLKVTKAKEEALLQLQKAEIEYLINGSFDDITQQLQKPKLPSLEDLLQTKANKDILYANKEVDLNKAKLKSIDLEHYSDVEFFAGYAYRKNFDDYVSFGLTLPLPIYGSEDIKTKMAQKKLLEAQAKAKDQTLAITKQIKQTYALLKREFEIYTIIQTDTMPKVEHILELTTSMVSSGEMLFKYIEVLDKKLRLDEASTIALANYYIYYAQITKLQGKR